MPLVRIDAPSASPQRLIDLGNATHQALIDAFGIPADDRFQVLRSAGTDQIVYDKDYLGVRRDDDVAFIQVFLRHGRTDEQKRAFYRAVASHAAAAGIDARNLLIVLTENTLADWSFGNGAAQYLDHPPQTTDPTK